EVGKLATFMFVKHRIIVTPIAHPEFNCLRITPNVYTTLAEIDRFCEVMEDVLRKGLPAQGSRATIRSGPPLPPLIFIGSAITNAPVTGSSSKCATFSNAGTF